MSILQLLAYGSEPADTEPEESTGGMLMVNKEADHKIQTRTAVPLLFRTAKGEIAKQAAAVNGQDERATPAARSHRLFCFTADKAVKLKSA